VFIPDEVRTKRAENQQALNEAFASGKLDVSSMPIHLMAEPKNICNAKCPLCPTGIGELNRAKSFLSYDVFKSFIDQAYPFAETLNLWNYGEPFLHRQIFDMITYACDKYIDVRVSTNGYVFYDERNITRLIDCGLPYLIVGLDGASSEVFSQYRVNVKFDKVIKGMKLLRDTKRQRQADHPIVDWQFIAMRHNYHEIDAAREMAAEVGAIFSVKTVNIQMINVRPSNSTYVPDNPSLRRYNVTASGALEFSIPVRNLCNFPWHTLQLNSNGEIVPCCYDIKTELLLGDMRHQTLAEIWNGSRMQELRRNMITNRNTLSPCATCSSGSYDVLFLEKPDARAIQQNREFYLSQ